MLEYQVFKRIVQLSVSLPAIAVEHIGLFPVFLVELLLPDPVSCFS